jgi:sporulation integral membrane protein YlbJ
MPRQKKSATIFWSLLGIVIVVMLIRYPEQSFQAAIDGLKVWWDIVLPALLPFFIIADILMGLGVVSFLGTLLEPLMRPMFNVAGEGAFAFAMGLASGYPLGARISAELYKKGYCSRTETERLLCFSNTADPIFMIGAVAVGMFNNASVGLAIVFSHYVSAILVGILLSFLEKRPQVKKEYNRQSIFKKAWTKMHLAREEDGRSFGDILGDSVSVAIESLFKVGGFIIFFAVLIRLMELMGLAGFLERCIGLIMTPFFGPGLAKPLIGGFLEITIGCQLAAVSYASLANKLAVTNAIIAWSGLSVHGQVASMIQGTDLRLGLFIKSRIAHSLLAFLITPLSVKLFPYTLPVWAATKSNFGGWAIFGTVLVFSLLISLVIDTWQKAKITWLRW